MNEIASWLYNTRFSRLVQVHDWVVPTVQTIHILAMCVVFSSVFATCLGTLGWVGRGQTRLATLRRFAPWFWTALLIMLATGVVLVFGEPARELLSVSFWVKMSLLAIGTVIAAIFQSSLRRSGADDQVATARSSTRAIAFISLFIWIGIAVLGRFIAWDALIWARN